MIGSYVLDTDMLSLLDRGHPGVIARLLSHHPGRLAISVITVEEQLTGWYSLLRASKKPDRLAMSYRRLAETVRLQAQFRILTFTEEAIARYESLKSARLNVNAMDLRIAAIVLEVGGTLISRNLRDFRRVPGLTVEDWSA